MKIDLANFLTVTYTFGYFQKKKEILYSPGEVKH